MCIYLVKTVVEWWRYCNDLEAWVLKSTDIRDIIACETNERAEKEALMFRDSDIDNKIKHKENDLIRSVNVVGYNNSDKIRLYDHQGLYYLEVIYEDNTRATHNVSISKIKYVI